MDFVYYRLNIFQLKSSRRGDSSPPSTEIFIHQTWMINLYYFFPQELIPLQTLLLKSYNIMCKPRKIFFTSSPLQTDLLIVKWWFTELILDLRLTKSGGYKYGKRYTGTSKRSGVPPSISGGRHSTESVLLLFFHYYTVRGSIRSSRQQTKVN